MPHDKNIVSFSRLDITTPLIKVYLKLVALEILLKDNVGWLPKFGHDIFSLSNELANSYPNMTTLTTLMNQLQTELSTIRCRGKNGSPINVDPSRYPNIRYIIHIDDDLTGTNDSELNKIDDIINDIYLTIRTNANKTIG
jgi:hypothetical protein